MSDPARTRNGPVARFLALPNDSTAKTLGVALIICLVSAAVVSVAAVGLRERQGHNRAALFKENILEVAGLLREESDIDELFAGIEARLVDLESGEYVSDIDPATYDQRRAVRDPRFSHTIPREEDLARIRQRARYAVVYLLREEGELRRIILPVHGYGLWSTLYGFIALESDLNSVYGLKFYEHAETPGLGAEVDNPAWLTLWRGKRLYDENGALRISVIRGRVENGSVEAPYQVDGLGGATLTSNGVSNLVRYWLGENGFQPYLKRLRTERE